MMPGPHIFLTGFMGSGKSTLGKKLASLLNLEYTDLDRYIEENTEQSIQEMFELWGEEKFRETESLRLKEIIQANTTKVISLGGGTICYFDNLEKIKERGLLIYLDMSATALYSRVSSASAQRPLLKNYSGEELLQFIEEKLESRKSYYLQAHITVNGLNLTAQQLNKEISEYRQKNKL